MQPNIGQLSAQRVLVYLSIPLSQEHIELSLHLIERPICADKCLCAGCFGIFGHGNVTCLSEALEQVQETLPTWRGQNEQSMALAAIAFAKAKRRRQIMVATSSVGPGATNMVTAAGVAHANRLPVLLISGDTFVNRLPDPVLQQVEHFHSPSTSVNDSFRPVARYWDRITHPAQILSSLPQAIATMLDPADSGPAFIGLPQDTQELAYDYPVEFFEPKIWTIPRPRPSRDQVAAAAELLATAKKPLIISGGGVRYSGAETTLAEFARKVSLLCEERAEDETLDAIRKEAERLLQPTEDPVVYECRQWLNLRETQEELVIDNDGDSPELAEVTAELFAVERRLLALVQTSPEGVALLATVLWESEGPTAALGSPDYLRQLNSPEHQFLRRLRHGGCRVAGFNTDRPDYFAA